MNRVIGEGKTEEDHAALSNELLDRYERGKKAAAMAAGRGEESLTALERAYVSFADEFEKNYIGQGFGTVRSTEETLGLGRALLEKYFPKN
jgi:V/A-type H+-transporting ATPase subunit B